MKPASGVSRRTLVTGAAWTVPVLLAAGAAPAASASCWPVGTVFNSHGLGKFLSGTIANQNLDLLASINAAQADTPGPVTPQHVEAFNSLDVTALSAINVDLSGTGALLSDLLGFLAPANAGAYNQYAMADSNGQSRGASGAVSSNGAVDTGVAAGNVEVGSVDLKVILENLAGAAAGGALANIADLKLKIGAVAGRAFVDNTECTPDNQDVVTRDYLLAYLRLLIKSQLVGNLVTALKGLTSIPVDTDAIWNALVNIPALAPIAALGKAALQVSVTANLGSLTGQIPTVGGHALQINLDQGEILLDLGALLGGPYTGTISPALNGLAPNSRLLVDATLPVNAVSHMIDTWLNDLVDAIKDLVSITVRIGTTTGIGATGLLFQGTLRQFLEGTATTSIVALGVPINLGGLLGPLLKSIGDVVVLGIKALFGPGGALNATWAPVETLLANVLDLIENVLVLTVNAQNAAPGAIPAPFQTIPAGRYDVAALHIGLVQSALLNLFLARGSVGPNRPR